MWKLNGSEEVNEVVVALSPKVASIARDISGYILVKPRHMFILLFVTVSSTLRLLTRPCFQNT